MERVRGKVRGGRSEKVRGGGKVREGVRGGRLEKKNAENRPIEGLPRAYKGPFARASAEGSAAAASSSPWTSSRAPRTATSPRESPGPLRA